MVEDRLEGRSSSASSPKRASSPTTPPPNASKAATTGYGFKEGRGLLPPAERAKRTDASTIWKRKCFVPSDVRERYELQG
ncbi:hypothetical protein TrLO_g10559 [Triparma laevis f. longispina]|uniref:Uncharacterized protein n=1 Tax=Triparma laevis f. longispina TaxID=1714387 RepID=A0A9W7FTW9_9STRA|nr:hypothetical protein TrLO_g10559 [Triparma laevis f. longispina]